MRYAYREQKAMLPSAIYKMRSSRRSKRLWNGVLKHISPGMPRIRYLTNTPNINTPCLWYVQHKIWSNKAKTLAGEVSIWWLNQLELNIPSLNFGNFVWSIWCTIAAMSQSPCESMKKCWRRGKRYMASSMLSPSKAIRLAQRYSARKERQTKQRRYAFRYQYFQEWLNFVREYLSSCFERRKLASWDQEGVARAHFRYHHVLKTLSNINKADFQSSKTFTIRDHLKKKCKDYLTDLDPSNELAIFDQMCSMWAGRFTGRLAQTSTTWPVVAPYHWKFDHRDLYRASPTMYLLFPIPAGSVTMLARHACLCDIRSASHI